MKRFGKSSYRRRLRRIKPWGAAVSHLVLDEKIGASILKAPPEHLLLAVVSTSTLVLVVHTSAA